MCLTDPPEHPAEYGDSLISPQRSLPGPPGEAESHLQPVYVNRRPVSFWLQACPEYSCSIRAVPKALQIARQPVPEGKEATLDSSLQVPMDSRSTTSPTARSEPIKRAPPATAAS